MLCNFVCKLFIGKYFFFYFECILLSTGRFIQKKGEGRVTRCEKIHKPYKVKILQNTEKVNQQFTVITKKKIYQCEIDFKNILFSCLF